MKFFEKNIKDRFKNASSLDGVDPDDLWNDIESSIASESPQRKFVFFRKKYLLLLISIFIVAGFAIWNHLSDESNSTKEQIEFNEKTKNQKKEERERERNTATYDANQEKSNIIIEKKKIERQTLKQSENLENLSASVLSKKVNDNPQKISTNKNDFEKSISKEDTPNLAKIENRNSNKTKISNNNSQDISTPIQKKVLEVDQLFDGQKINLTQIASLALLLQNKKNNQLSLDGIINSSKFDRKNSKFSFGIFTGIHTLKNNFTTNLVSEKNRRDILNQGYHYELGYSFAIEANWYLNKNIFVTSGLEYLQSKSEFNFMRNWDTIIVNPNSHVGSLTDASAVRTVKHHNKMDYFSIPILLGLEKSYWKIKIGISAGIGLNFTKNQTGKSINANNQIATYPSNENSHLPVSTFFLSYHLRPHLNYDIDEKTSFQLRADFRLQNFGTSSFYNLNYSSIFSGLSGGVQFRF